MTPAGPCAITRAGRPVRRRPSRVTAVAVGAVGALALAACGSSAGGSGGSGGSLKVGMIIPQQGVYAPVGTDIKNGFQLYLDQHDGKLDGRKVTVDAGDEGTGPNDAIPTAQRLHTRDKVDVLTGIVNSAVGIALIDTINRAKKVTLVSNAGSNALTCGKAAKYIWRTSFANSTDGAALGKYMATQVKPPSVYVIAADYAAGHEKADGFQKALTAAGGKVVGSAYPPFGTTRDYQPYLSKIKAAHPAAVWAFFASDEAVQFVKQYKQFGLGNIPLYGNNALTDGNALTAEGAAATGVHISSFYSAFLDTPTNKAFVDAYQAKFHTRPSGYSVSSYDAAAALDKALKVAKGSSDGDKLTAALAKIGAIDSPRGSWTFGPNHNPIEDYKLYQVQRSGGASTLVQQADLGKLQQTC